MPQAIVYAGAWLLTQTTAFVALGAFLLTNAAVIGYGLLLVGAYALQERAKRKARDQYNASQVDRLQSVSTTTGPRELVLGKVRKGGVVIFRDSCGTHQEKFAMVVALANHKISGVEKYYLNEKEVTLDGSGYVVEAPYANSVARIRIIDGSQTTADATLMSLFPGVWTANHKLLGVAYAIIELSYNESAFPSGVPNFTALIRGAEVYDPRTGITAFSENPALHARHIITHPRFGKRTGLTSREEFRIIAAANACDTSYTPTGGSATQLYKSGVVLPFGGRAADALDDLCQGMCGMWAYAGGQFFIKAGVYTGPVKTLQASDLMTTQRDSQGGSTSKAITINTHKARADKINSVTAKIYDSGAGYKETTITPVKNAAAITKDGIELPLEISLPTVGSASQAQVVCNYMIKDSFDPLALTANFKLSAYELELFDNVAINLPRYGWNNKVFTVLGRNFSPTGSVELTLRETSAELFNPLIASNSNGFASNTNLVEPWDIDHPGVLTMSSGTSELLMQGDGSVITRVRVQWAGILDERVRQGGYVEVRWKAAASQTWSTISVPGVESSAYLLGAIDGSTIVVMARTRTQLAVSDWNVQTTHLVLGKTEPPVNVQGFGYTITQNGVQLTWSASTDVDYAKTTVRSGSNWASAQVVTQSSSTTHLLDWLPAGYNTYLAKHLDTSGNESIYAVGFNIYIFAPSAPTSLAYQIRKTGVYVTWGAPAVLADQQPLKGIELSWLADFSVLIDTRSTNSVELGWLPAGNYTLHTRYVDVAGNKGTAANVSITVAAPSAPAYLTVGFGTSNIEASWTAPAVLANQQPLDRVELSWTSSFIVIIDAKKSTTTAFGWLPAGNYTLYARYVDVAGNIGAVSQASLQVLPPAQVTMTAVETQVNLVTLRWQDAKTSQPIRKYAIYYADAGTSLAGATLYGSAGADSRSDILQYRSSGAKVAYLVAEDVAGNVGAARQIDLSIKMPDNFVLSTEYYEDWQSAELTNGTIVGGSTGQIILPANDGRTWGQRLSNNGWSSAQDKINAGYPVLIQQVPTTGKHVERKDCGKVIATSVVRVTPTILNTSVAGYTATIRIRASVGASTANWQPWIVGDAVSFSNFQHVEVEYGVVSDGKGFVVIDDLYVKVEVTEVTESAILVLNPADAAGTVYVCTKPFLDVRGVQVTPQGSSSIARPPWYVIDDSTLPAKVYVFAADASNNRTGGTVSLFITGV